MVSPVPVSVVIPCYRSATTIRRALLSVVSPAQAGQASGTNNAIREVGGVFGVAVLATVFSGSGTTCPVFP